MPSDLLDSAFFQGWS